MKKDFQYYLLCPLAYFMGGFMALVYVVALFFALCGMGLYVAWRRLRGLAWVVCLLPIAAGADTTVEVVNAMDKRFLARLNMGTVNIIYFIPSCVENGGLPIRYYVPNGAAFSIGYSNTVGGATFNAMQLRDGNTYAVAGTSVGDAGEPNRYNYIVMIAHTNGILGKPGFSNATTNTPDAQIQAFVWRRDQPFWSATTAFTIVFIFLGAGATLRWIASSFKASREVGME